MSSNSSRNGVATEGLSLVTNTIFIVYGIVRNTFNKLSQGLLLVKSKFSGLTKTVGDAQWNSTKQIGKNWVKLLSSLSMWKPLRLADTCDAEVSYGCCSPCYCECQQWCLEDLLQDFFLGLKFWSPRAFINSSWSATQAPEQERPDELLQPFLCSIDNEKVTKGGPLNFVALSIQMAFSIAD